MIIIVWLNFQDNDYVAVIKSVATMLADYDSDKKFPVFGFGAKAPEFFQGVSYCFPLNFDSHDPEVVGIQASLIYLMSRLMVMTLKPRK